MIPVSPSLKEGGKVFQGEMLQYRPSEVWVQQTPKRDYPARDVDGKLRRPRSSTVTSGNLGRRCFAVGEKPVEHPEFKIACPDWADVLKRLWLREWVEKATLKLT